jgi:hypothetical protein
LRSDSGNYCDPLPRMGPERAVADAHLGLTRVCRLPHHVIGGLLVAFLAVAIGLRLRDAAPETIERTQRSGRGQGGLGGDRFRRLQPCVHDRSQVSGSRTGWRNGRRLGGGDDSLGRAGLGRCGRVALASWHSLARDSRRADLGSRRGALGNRRWVAGPSWWRGLGDGRWIVLGPSLRTRSSCDSVGLPPEVVADRPPGNIHQNQLNYDDRDPKQPLPTHRHFPLGEVNDSPKHRHVTQKQGPGRLRRLSQPDLRAVNGCCIVESPVFTRSFQSQSCRLWSPGRAPNKSEKGSPRFPPPKNLGLVLGLLETEASYQWRVGRLSQEGPLHNSAKVPEAMALRSGDGHFPAEASDGDPQCRESANKSEQIPVLITRQIRD